MLTRRQLMLAAGGLAAAGTLGSVVAAQAASEEDLARAAITRLLGPFEMPQDDFRKFTAAIMEQRGFPKSSRVGPLTFAERTGFIDVLLDQLPSTVLDGYAQWRRVIMTDFMLSTEFFQQPGKPLSFSDLATTCTSPFAEFS